MIRISINTIRDTTVIKNYKLLISTIAGLKKNISYLLSTPSIWTTRELEKMDIRTGSERAVDYAAVRTTILISENA